MAHLVTQMSLIALVLATCPAPIMACNSMQTGKNCNGHQSFDLANNACAATGDNEIPSSQSTCSVKASTDTTGSFCWFPSGLDLHICFSSQSSGTQECQDASSPSIEGWSKPAGLTILTLTNKHEHCGLSVSDLSYCCTPISQEKATPIAGDPVASPGENHAAASAAQTPDLCSIVQPYIGPCQCLNEAGGLKISCDVNIIGLDTVGVAMDLQPCASPVVGDIEVTEKDIPIDWKLEKVGAGTNDVIPIPGFSLGIGPLSAGVFLDIQMDGGTTDLEVKLGFNLCVDILIRTLCGSQIPGVSGILPVIAFHIGPVDFSSACNGNGTATAGLSSAIAHRQSRRNVTLSGGADAAFVV